MTRKYSIRKVSPPALFAGRKWLVMVDGAAHRYCRTKREAMAEVKRPRNVPKESAKSRSRLILGHSANVIGFFLYGSGLANEMRDGQ